MRRRAFSLLEVLIAVALFGIASAGLLMAVSPAYDGLFNLSEAPKDAGDLELAKNLVESITDRTTLLAGGNFALPSGDPLAWHVDLTPTDTEALFIVRLTASRTNRTALTAEYLHFEPRWMNPTDAKPQWLPHLAGGGGGGGGGGPRPEGAPEQGDGHHGQGKGPGRTTPGEPGPPPRGEGRPPQLIPRPQNGKAP